MSTKIDKNGIICNKIVADELQTSDGTKYFKETDLDSITINDAAIENATKIAVDAATSAENDATDANTAKLAAETAAENALASSTTAEQAKTDALAAQTKAEEEAAKAEQNATLLGDAALQSQNNVFAADYTQTFNGNVVINENVDFPNGSTTVAEMAAGYFFARRYWELATDISNLFKEQYIDALPKNDEGLVELNFPAAKTGKDAFVKCHCSGAAISLPSVTTQENLTAILNGLNNSNGNSSYGFGVFRLNLPEMTSISLDYPLRLWAKKIIIDAPKATYFKIDARKLSCYGNLPIVEEVRYDNSYYTHYSSKYKWFVPLSMLKNGYFGDPSSVGDDKIRLSGDSVLCILGTIPIWDDETTHLLHLNISPDLQNDASFQERLMTALGPMAEDGTYGGALVRTYSSEGISGTDELGPFDDAFVATKGWKITISYN